MKQRFLFLLRTYGLTVLLFLLAKVVFMLCNASGHDVSASDYVDVLRHGLSLDLSTALYFLAVPLLVSLASVWVKVPRWVLIVYFAIISFAFALAFVADTSLYTFWGFKLDASCLQYLSQPEGITQSVSVGYLLLRFLLVVALTISFFLLYSFRLDSPPANGPHLDSPPANGPHLDAPITNRTHIDAPPDNGSHLDSPPAKGSHLDSPPANGSHLDSPPANGSHLDSPPFKGRGQGWGLKLSRRNNTDPTPNPSPTREGSEAKATREGNETKATREGNEAKTTREGNEAKTSTKKKIILTCVHVLLLPLMVIGIRGGLDESTTNIGQVYYSQNQFLNHAAVNPVFSFLYSLSHQLGDLSQYDFMDDAECKRLTDNVYTTESVLTDTLLTTTRPNVVIILLESAGEQFAEAMPRLQQLKQEGINFSRCYANSWRTDRGTVCTLSGYPSFPSVSVMKMPEKSRLLPSVARTLKGQGYKTAYLYGGDINFTNMRSYLIGTGWERLISMDDYSHADQHSANWGVRDDITFNTLYNEIVKAPPSAPEGATIACQQTNEAPSGAVGGASPFLWGYSTLSSHEPWDVPVHKKSDEVQNAFAYVDDCLYDFVEHLKQTPAWDNLLIVITADHGINHDRIDQSTPLQKNHIPMLWIGGAVKEPRTIDVICNQSDMAATLLGQLQLPHEDFAFSRDVLSQTYVYPTAVHNYYNAQWMIDSTGHALYDFDAQRFIVSETVDADRLLRISKALLQLTTQSLKN